MARKEFSRKTKRQALERSGGLCEATGSWYGLDDGQRCNADLGYGVQFDHIVLDANSKDNTLENCAAVCPKCHRHKTSKRDVPLAAKTRRQLEKNQGIRRPPKSRSLRKPEGMRYNWGTGRYEKIK